MVDDCCSDNYHAPRTALCPANGEAYRSVPLQTVLHHVSQPWQHKLTDKHYYFCNDPVCPVVYYTAQVVAETSTNLQTEPAPNILNVADLRSTPGQKSTQENRTICYCFDIHMSDITSDESRLLLKQFIIDKTAAGLCACETRNPSGRCCLADFPSQ